MEKFFSYIKNNKLLILFLLICFIFTLKGIQSYWYDFTEVIFKNKLEVKGIKLEVEETLVIKNLKPLEEETKKILEQVKKVDYQTYKKNAKSKMEDKGIVVVDNDIVTIKSADSLLAKWKRK